MAVKKLIGIIVIVLGIYAFSVSDGDGLPEKFNSRLLTWKQQNPIEKVYLHTDRDHYEVGERVWFKAYLVDGITHKFSPFSRFVYVELRDRQDSLFGRVKLARIDSVYAGYLDLSKNLLQGEYVLRAYSYWMQNAGDDYIFRKKIRVINPHDSRVLTEVREEQTDKGKEAVVRFYNSREEFYNRVLVTYEWENKSRRLRTDDAGCIRIPLDEELQGQKIKVKFSEDCPFHFERYVYLPDSSVDFDVSFMPEGGDLVAGQVQKVAYKVIGRDGLSRYAEGMLVDDCGQQISYVKTLHKGMSAFELSVEEGRKYYVDFKVAGDSVKRFALPDVKRDAIALRLISDRELVRYSVLVSGEMKRLKDLYIAVHARGVPLYCVPLAKKWKGELCISELPEGIVTFVLLDGACRVLSQRLCFVRHSAHSEIMLETARERYDIRDSVHLNISLPFDAGAGTFSVAVTDESRVEADTLQDNILSYLLMTSDLKGYIEDPAFYFSNNQTETHSYLDLLMLTQGWTRFDIEGVLKGEMNRPTYYMEVGQAISGQVKNFWGKDAGEANLILLGNGVFRSVQADSAGRFMINGITFPDSTSFILQGMSKRGKRSVEIFVDRDEFMAPYVVLPVGGEILKRDEDFYERFMKDYYYDNGMKVYVLDEVVVQRQKMKKIYSFYDVVADYQLDSAQLASMRGQDIRQVFMEFPGVEVCRDSVTRFGKKLHVLVDDLEEDWNYISLLLPEDLVNISMVLPPKSYTMLGKEAENGLMVITTNPNFVPSDKSKLNMTTVTLLGYQKPVEFYVPHYEVDSVRSALADKVDLRSTIYWNPDVWTDSNGRAQCYFTTSDGSGPYRVVVEGILRNGTVCRQEKRIFLR